MEPARSPRPLGDGPEPLSTPPPHSLGALGLWAALGAHPASLLLAAGGGDPAGRRVARLWAEAAAFRTSRAGRLRPDGLSPLPRRIESSCCNWLLSSVSSWVLDLEEEKQRILGELWTGFLSTPGEERSAGPGFQGAAEDRVSAPRDKGNGSDARENRLLPRFRCF